MITRSELEHWTPDGHAQAASYLQQEAARADQTFTTAHAQIADSTWAGRGGTSATTHYATDQAAVDAHGTLLRTSAQTMTTAGETLGNIKNEIMGMIANIEGQQFAVSEDWKVTDVSGLPEEIKQFREPARSTFETALQAEVQGFEQAHQGVTATLTGHATSIGGFQFPQSPRKPSWCPPEEMPGRCLSDAQGGGTSIWPTHTPDGKLSPGAFNDGIQIDTSHASIRGLPDQWTLGGADGPGIPHDWPMPLTGSTGPQPFLPKWQQDMIAPSVPPNPPLTVQTPNGQMTLLPPLRDFPAPMPMPPSPFENLSPPGMPPVPPGGTLQQGITDGARNGLPVLQPNGYMTGGPNPVTPLDTTPIPSPNPWTGPGGVWDQTGYSPSPPPTPPHLPDPPVMTAIPDDQYVAWPGPVLRSAKHLPRRNYRGCGDGMLQWNGRRCSGIGAYWARGARRPSWLSGRHPRGYGRPYSGTHL